MSETTAQDRRPNMAFKAPETYDGGMRVSEMDIQSMIPAGAPFKGSYWTVEPGGSSPEDVHSVHEMWLVASGRGELLCGGRPVRVEAGDVLYFEPHQTHEVRNDGDAALAVFSVWWPS